MDRLDECNEINLIEVGACNSYHAIMPESHLTHFSAQYSAQNAPHDASHTQPASDVKPVCFR